MKKENHAFYNRAILPYSLYELIEDVSYILHVFTRILSSVGREMKQTKIYV